MFRIDKSSVELSKASEGYVTPYTTIAQQLKQVERAMDREDESESTAEPGESVSDLQRQFELEQQLEAVNARRAQAESEAARLIADAESKAQAILQQAGSDAEGLKNQGYSDGFSAGQVAGREEVIALQRKSADELRAFVESLKGLRSEIVDQAYGELLTLSIDIAGKILNIELDRSDEAFISLVQSALSRMRTDGKIYVNVSKQEYERFFQSGDSPLYLDDDSVQVVVVPDGQLTRGSCLIEADGQTINASMDSQLKSVEDAFFDNESNGSGND